MYPVWLLQLFGQAKSFRANPLLGSPLLNRLGLHVIRVLVAHSAAHVRWFFLSAFMTPDHRRQYHRDGFVVIKDFLSAAQLAAVHRDIPRIPVDRDPPRQMIQGDTLTQRILLDTTVLNETPGIANIIRAKSFTKPIMYGGAKANLPLIYLQRIRNGSVSGKADPQKTMHSDTFHPSAKAWLFLEDVTQDMGPFTYVPGSHKLTRKRLGWEYARSCKGRHLSDGYSEKGSLRADSDDLRQMDLPDPVGITASAGTLVIANTNGFHGRGQAAAGAVRSEIWAYARTNPFNPLPGISLDAGLRVRTRILQAFWAYKDKKAAAKGSRASWHPIALDDFLGQQVGKQMDRQKSK